MKKYFKSLFAFIFAFGLFISFSSVDVEAVITCATGCLEVSSFMYPYTAWKNSFIHNAFENAGATCSGVEAAYRALKKKGKVKKHS